MSAELAEDIQVLDKIGGNKFSDTKGVYIIVDDFTSHYKLESNALDATGNYNGTELGNTYELVNGKGSVASFDGVDDYITIPSDATSLDNTTFCFWYRVTGTGTGGDDSELPSDVFFSKGRYNSSFTGMVVLRANDATVAKVMYHKGSGVIGNALYVFDIPAEVGTFHHLAFHHDNSGVDSVLTVFIDGEYHGSHSTTNSTFDNSLDLMIGAGLTYNNGTIGDFLKGNISNLRIYDRVLSSLEINSIYNSELDNTPKYKNKLSVLDFLTDTDPTPQDYVAYYPLTGTAEDKTGNYDGVENGGLTYVDDSERGSVVNFDGVDDIISDSIYNISDSGSLSYYIKSNDLIKQHIQTSKFFCYRDYIFIWDANNGKENYTSYNMSSFMKTGEWNHIYVDTNTIAVNGHIIDVTGVSGVASYIYDVGTIGGGFNRTNGFYYANTQLSSIRIYDRVLSTKEIETIYNYEKITHNVPVDDGLIAYYPLKKNSKDNWYNQFNGTDTGVVYDGQSASFDGVDDKIDISQISSQLKIQNFSISCWVKKVDDSNVTFFGYTNHNYYYGYTLNSINSKYRFTSYGDNGVAQIDIQSESNIVVGKFQHVVVTISDNNIRMYINGEIIISESSQNILFDTTMYSLIGENSIRNDYNRYMKGNLSDFRFYNKALSDNEIKEIYDTELPEFIDLTIPKKG